MEGIVESNVEPVVLSRELVDVHEVVHKLIKSLNKSISSIEAVGLRNGVNRRQLVVLETISKTVENGGEGLSIELSVTNNGPLLVNSLLRA